MNSLEKLDALDEKLKHLEKTTHETQENEIDSNKNAAFDDRRENTET